MYSAREQEQNCCVVAVTGQSEYPRYRIHRRAFWVIIRFYSGNISLYFTRIRFQTTRSLLGLENGTSNACSSEPGRPRLRSGSGLSK